MRAFAEGVQGQQLVPVFSNFMCLVRQSFSRASQGFSSLAQEGGSDLGVGLFASERKEGAAGGRACWDGFYGNFVKDRGNAFGRERRHTGSAGRARVSALAFRRTAAHLSRRRHIESLH